MQGCLGIGPTSLSSLPCAGRLIRPRSSNSSLFCCQLPYNSKEVASGDMPQFPQSSGTQQGYRVSVRVTEGLVRITRTACEGALRSQCERPDDLEKTCRSLIEISEHMLMNKHCQSQAGAAGVCVGVVRRCGFPSMLDFDNPGDTVSACVLWSCTDRLVL